MDELSRLVANARDLVRGGYYEVKGAVPRSPSFLEGFGDRRQRSRLIAEIKYASPAMASGKSTAGFRTLLDSIAAAKPLGVSVLAEPRIFGGHKDFVRIAASKGLPVLFKDIVVDPVQIEAAAACGASAVLVIETLFARDLIGGRSQDLLDEAHDRDLDVVLEAHTIQDWEAALATDADILGINHRDLTTMEVDSGTTVRLLSARAKDRPTIAMSGFETRAQVEAALRAGADAVLVGASIMRDPDPARKLEELQHG